MKKQIPILFSTAMVHAILAGRKTVTRRIVNPQPGSFLTAANWKKHVSHCPDHWTEDEHIKTFMSDKSPYGKPGDILYVREEHYQQGIWRRNGVTKKGNPKWNFETTHPAVLFDHNKPALFEVSRNKAYSEKVFWYKRLARFMPKDCARIWLEVTNIRVERLQDISDADAKAEGLAAITKDNGRTWKYGIPDKDGYPGTDDNGWPWHKWSTDPREAFFKLWVQINGEESLVQNPWLWVVSFKVLSATGKPAGLEKEVAG